MVSESSAKLPKKYRRRERAHVSSYCPHAVQSQHKPSLFVCFGPHPLYAKIRSCVFFSEYSGLYATVPIVTCRKEPAVKMPDTWHHFLFSPFGNISGGGRRTAFSTETSNGVHLSSWNSAFCVIRQWEMLAYLVQFFLSNRSSLMSIIGVESLCLQRRRLACQIRLASLTCSNL